MKSINYVLTSIGAVIILGGRVCNVPNSHINYRTIVEVLRSDAPEEEKFQVLEALIDISAEIESYCEGRITIEDGVIEYKGEAISGDIVNRILEMKKRNAPFTHLINFLDHLSENPSMESKKDLYRFLNRNNLPITSDGYFLAYKKVREDYKDLHSGTFDNSVGAVVEMGRDKVDPDRDQTCSAGLHAASLNYMPTYGDRDSSRIIIVKINPADVVAVPTDYNDAKLRCCRYEVIAEMEDRTTKLRSYSVEETNELFSDEEEPDEPDFNAFDDEEYFDDGYDGGEALDGDEEFISGDYDSEGFLDDEDDGFDWVEWVSSGVQKAGWLVEEVNAHQSASAQLERCIEEDFNLASARRSVFNKAYDISSVDRIIVKVVEIDGEEVTPILYIPQSSKVLS